MLCMDKSIETMETSFEIETMEKYEKSKKAMDTSMKTMWVNEHHGTMD